MTTGLTVREIVARDTIVAVLSRVQRDPDLRHAMGPASVPFGLLVGALAGLCDASIEELTQAFSTDLQPANARRLPEVVDRRHLVLVLEKALRRVDSDKLDDALADHYAWTMEKLGAK